MLAYEELQLYKQGYVHGCLEKSGPPGTMIRSGKLGVFPSNSKRRADSGIPGARPANVCIYIYIYIYIYVYLSICIERERDIYIYIYTHMCIHIYIYMYTYIHIHIHIHIRIYILYMFASTHQANWTSPDPSSRRFGRSEVEFNYHSILNNNVKPILVMMVLTM